MDFRVTSNGGPSLVSWENGIRNLGPIISFIIFYFVSVGSIFLFYSYFLLILY
jgi:hypothetical protein